MAIGTCEAWHWLRDMVFGEVDSNLRSGFAPQNRASPAYDANMRTPLVECAGLVEASLDRVTDLVLTVREGEVGQDNAWLFQDGSEQATVTGGPDRFSFEAPGHSGTIEVDRDQRMIAFQGGWWYRGVYRLEPDTAGTRIVHRVYNAATRARWGVPLANKLFIGFDDQTRASFARTLAGIGAELDCAYGPTG